MMIMPDTFNQWLTFAGVAASTIVFGSAGCVSPEMCDGETFGAQCRGTSVAICSPRPVKDGGGSVVQTESCGSAACSTHYGDHHALCMPAATQTLCKPTTRDTEGHPFFAAFERERSVVASAFGTLAAPEVRIEDSVTGETIRSTMLASGTVPLAVADLNGDGTLDLIVRSGDASARALQWANGVGVSFDPFTLLDDGDFVGVADLGTDAHDAWLTVDWKSRPVTLRAARMNQDGAIVLLGAAPFDSLAPVVAVGDVDGDGSPEVVVAGTVPIGTKVVDVFRRTPAGFEQAQHGSFASAPPSAIVVARSNVSGPATLGISQLNSKIAWLRPQGTGFSAPIFTDVPESSDMRLVTHGSNQELVAPLSRAPAVLHAPITDAALSPRFEADAVNSSELHMIPVRLGDANAPLLYQRGPQVILDACP